MVISCKAVDAKPYQAESESIMTTQFSWKVFKGTGCVPSKALVDAVILVEGVASTRADARRLGNMYACLNGSGTWYSIDMTVDGVTKNIGITQVHFS